VDGKPSTVEAFSSTTIPDRVADMMLVGKDGRNTDLFRCVSMKYGQMLNLRLKRVVRVIHDPDGCFLFGRSIRELDKYGKTERVKREMGAGAVFVQGRASLL
jgi:hypothetical protein